MIIEFTVATWAYLFKMAMLVNKTLKFRTYYMYLQKCYQFLPVNMRNFCIAKVPQDFSTKNITAIDYVNAIRFNEPVTNNFVKLTMLQTTRP